MPLLSAREAAGCVVISCDHEPRDGSSPVFEAIQQRQRGPSLWKAFGVVTTICGVLVWGGMKLYEQRLDHESEERHEVYVEQRAESEAALTRITQGERVRLPGMSVLLPGKTVTGDRHHGEATSSTQIEGVFVEMNLFWDDGSMPDAIRRRQRANMRAGAMSPAFLDVTATNDERTSGANSVYTYTYATGYQTAIIGIGVCDGRVIELAVASPGGAGKLFDRLLGGFRCTPGTPGT